MEKILASSISEEELRDINPNPASRRLQELAMDLLPGQAELTRILLLELFCCTTMVRAYTVVPKAVPRLSNTFTGSLKTTPSRGTQKALVILPEPTQISEK